MNFHQLFPGSKGDPPSKSQQADGSHHCPDVDGTFGHCCLPGDCPSDAKAAADCEEVAGSFSVAYVTSGWSLGVKPWGGMGPPVVPSGND